MARLVLSWNYSYLLFGCLLPNLLRGGLASAVKTVLLSVSQSRAERCAETFSSSTDQGMQLRRFQGDFTAARQGQCVGEAGV